MKKIIIGVVIAVLVVVAYLGQVAYMGTLNQKIFNLAQKENDFFSIEDMQFEKGFFTSKANFLLYIKIEATDLFSLGLGQMPIGVEVRFKNNIFAKDNVDISFENPLYELLKDNFEGKMTMDKTFVNVKANVSLFGNVKLTTKFTDIDIQQDEFIIKLKNLISEAKMDLSGKYYGSQIILDELDIDIGSDKFFVKNMHLDESLDQGVDYAEYMEQFFVSSKMTTSIEQMQVYDVSLSDINSNKHNSKDKEGLGKANMDIHIKSVVSPLTQIKLDDISSTIEMSNISSQALTDIQNLSEYMDFEKLSLTFFSSNPIIELKSLDFSSNGHKVSSKGTIKGSKNEFSATFFVESEAVPSEILPPLQLFGINEFFVEKEGKYILDLAVQSNYENTKMTLNGKNISDE